MNKGLFHVLMILPLLLLPREGSAMTLAEVAAKVEQTYEGFHTLEASFVQESRVAALGGRTRRKEGRIFFSKPGHMRWEYERPEPQLIIADGVNLWYYRPEKKQVIVRALDGAFNSQTPLLFLFGEGKLAEEFTWEDQEAGPGDLYVLNLTPKRETPDLVGLKIEVRAEDFTVAATVLRDAFGNETRLEFDDEKVNGHLDDGLFVFEPPADAEVLNP